MLLISAVCRAPLLATSPRILGKGLVQGIFNAVSLRRLLLKKKVLRMSAVHQGPLELGAPFRSGPKQLPVAPLVPGQSSTGLTSYLLSCVLLSSHSGPGLGRTYRWTHRPRDVDHIIGLRRIQFILLHHIRSCPVGPPDHHCPCSVDKTCSRFLSWTYRQRYLSVTHSSNYPF